MKRVSVNMVDLYENNLNFLVKIYIMCSVVNFFYKKIESGFIIAP